MTDWQTQLSLVLLLSSVIAHTVAVISPALLAGSTLNSDEEDEPVISNSYILPNQIFNDGKPYYASKDPISGQLDFNAKKVVSIDGNANEVIDPNEKVILAGTSPNIHDFLNLPVKYSSSKFVYPLVSSSYANLKYQGSNKNFISNKKPQTQVAQVTTLSQYHTVSTTKLKPIPATAASVEKTVPSSTELPVNTSSSTKTITTTSSTTTTNIITTKKPKTSHPTISIKTTTPKIKTTTTSTTTKMPSSTTPKTSTAASTSKTTATRKKFVPTKKLGAFLNHTVAPATSTSKEKASTTAAPISTQSTKPINFFPTKSTSTTSYVTETPTIKTTPIPVSISEGPKVTPAFSPLPHSTHLPNINPADVYYTLEQKHTETDYEQKPSITFADIFNSLAEEESAILANNVGSQGIDAQGNLMVPFTPSKPAPFSTHEQQQLNPLQQQRPSYDMTTQAPSYFLSSTSLTTPKSDTEEKYNNEYVSYQVQQPNLMQYRPVPGTINNVVISPGQQSATFVLGSQQKVGTNAFGTVEKDELYPKNPSVQYGTVINEDISTVDREQSISNEQKPSSEAGPSNANFPQSVSHFTIENVRHEMVKPYTVNTYPEPIPNLPSSYQQLPYMSSKNRNKPTQNHLQFPADQNPADSVALSTNQDTKELLVSTNIRFPASESHRVEEMPSMSVSGNTPASPQINGHAQPLSLQQIQNSNTVIFPQSEANKGQQNMGGLTADEIQIQKHEVLTMNQHQQQLASAPAQHMIPPPIHPPALPKGSPDLEQQKPYRPTHSSPQYTYNEYTRKPIPGITRPNPDRHLPNILPQFRPNAKLSSGHASSNFNQEPGNIRVTGPIPPKRPQLGHGNPQFSHRRQPLGQQKRYPLNKMNDYPSGPSLAHVSDPMNRRIYRVSPYNVQFVERLHPKNRHHMPYPPNTLRPQELYTVERQAVAPSLEKLPAFAEEDLVVNDLPIVPVKLETTKLEPVVTLQMLQTYKKPLTTAHNEDKLHQEHEHVAVSPSYANTTMSSDNMVDKPIYESSSDVYVVYPVKGSNEFKDPLATAESQNVYPAIAHIKRPESSDYKNTLLSVVRDRHQEPVLKHKKAQSLQQEAKQQQQLKQQLTKKNSFPYVIEKPDPSYAALHGNPTSSAGVFISPKIINSAYGGGTDAPIAIAYTPTEPPKMNYHLNGNMVTPHFKEQQPNTQTEQPLNDHDFDLRAQNYEKNFMAPFYPSLSLSSATNSPSSGWNILSSSTERNIYEKNNIDRSDNIKNNIPANTIDEASTKGFEIDKFQPELQGGFKPIYPPGYKFDSEEEEQKYRHQQEIAKTLQALTSRATEPTTTPLETYDISTPSTIPSTIVTPQLPRVNTTKSNEKIYETTSAKPTSTEKPKRSKFETSLAALLFGDDEEEEEEETREEEKEKIKSIEEEIQARQEPTKAMLSGPRSIPPIGPRSLKI